MRYAALLRLTAAWATIAATLSGCGGDARVELSAADALNEVAGQMAGTIEEYHGDVSRYDEHRQSSVVSAFVTRVKKDAADDNALAAHVNDFESALHKIREDQETEWARRSTAMDNVSLLKEMSRGLQKLAIQSLSLQDEMKRYLSNWITARQQQASKPQTPNAAKASNNP
jgi:hypothetical protein